MADMTDKEKMLWMFKQVHGEDEGSCYAEVYYDEHGDEAGVHLMKHGNVCWSKNKTDLVFDALIRHILWTGKEVIL